MVCIDGPCPWAPNPPPTPWYEQRAAMLDEAQAMAMSAALASIDQDAAAAAAASGPAGATDAATAAASATAADATGGGGVEGELSEEVAAAWLVALENSGGDLAAAAAAAQAAKAQWGGAGDAGMGLGMGMGMGTGTGTGTGMIGGEKKPSYPPKGDPLEVAPPFNGDASPSTSAAPGTVHYEESAVAAGTKDVISHFVYSFVESFCSHTRSH